MRSKSRRVTRSLLGLLVVGAASGIVAFVPTVASAATSEPTTVTLNAVRSPVAFGSETQTFTGTVTGQTGHGYPATGSVTVETSSHVVLCTVALTPGSTRSANFSCPQTTGSRLTASGTPYSVYASYAGGTSSAATNTYQPSTSTSQNLSVKTPEATSVTLGAVPSTVAHGFEQQTFSGTVTGQAGDGYPTTGAVLVKTSTNVVLCTASLTRGATHSANFSCVQTTGSKLAASGTPYKVYAAYAGGTSSSSTFLYSGSTSVQQTMTVVTPTPVTPTVTLNAPTSPVIYGAESQTFTGTVKGTNADGYPRTGAVTVKTSTGAVLCTGSLTEPGSSGTAHFTCDASTPSKLAVASYMVHAHYTGGASSNANYKYAAQTSTSRSLVVTNGTATSTTLTLNATSRQLGAETQEVFTVTVTGKSGDGYPEGRMTVKTTGGTPVCTSTVRSSGSSYTSKFTCSPGASALPAGSYKLAATYAPTSTHSSSTTGVTYAASVSGKKTFKVTAGTATTSSLSLNASSRASGAETAEVFTVTVTGKAGDGYPKGTVKVKTSTGTALCTVSTFSHTVSASTFSCSPRASALSPGSYTILASFTPGSPSSSTTAVTYAASVSNSVAFTVGTPAATRIAGSTPDATAAEELESVYPGSKGTCPGTTSSRSVVLANDAHFPDALAASYLAKWLGTGMLLTPTSALSSVTLTALAVEGITHVYVVGGPLAVSTAVVSELQSTHVFDCRGTTRTTAFLTVTRISGATQYTTAEDIAKTPGTSFVGSLDLQSAYGLYNDTSGKSSSAPSGTQRTAILASGAEFQDAEAAATVAYADDLPLLLTTPTTLSSQALSALSTLGVTQVILMGGPDAVSNTVVTQLVAQRISVLRVAGTTDTDTAVQLADLELASSASHLGLGWTPTGGVTVTRGNGFTDGLAGAVVAAHGGETSAGPEPMLLTESPSVVGSPLTSFLTGAGSHGIDNDGTGVYSLTVLGGALAVTTTVVNQIESYL